MHVEIIPSYTISVEQLNVAQALSCGTIDRLCIPGSILSNMNLTNYERLGLLVDYPMGLSSIEAKKRECAYAISHHIDHIDLVMSRYYIVNGYYDLLLKEIQMLYKYLKPKHKQMSIRCMFDFNLLNAGQLENIIEIIDYVGISQIALSTGTTSFEVSDMLIDIDIILNNSALEVFAGPIWNKDQFDVISQIPDISGVLFSSVHSFKQILKK
jgi:hypothetical protein